MAHPYANQVKKGSAAKFKAMTGKKSSGQSHPDEAQDKALIKKMLKQHDAGEYAVGGAVSTPSFARGGRTKKGKGNTNINIIIAGKDKEEAPPMPMPRPPMAPPPGLEPPGGPAGAPPMPGSPMPAMKRGGKVPMKAGAETGQGRLEKKRAYGAKA